jgi:hypothetical protein
MPDNHLFAVAVLTEVSGIISGPSLLASYRWRFGVGKHLGYRLGPLSPTPKRRQSLR